MGSNEIWAQNSDQIKDKVNSFWNDTWQFKEKIQVWGVDCHHRHPVTVDSIFSASCLNAWWCRWCSSHHKPRLLNGNPASSHAGVFFFFLKLQENHDLFTRELSCVATLSYIITIALLIKSSLYTLFSILHISAFFKIVQWKCVGSETIPLLILRLRNICWCENIPRANNSFRPYSIIYFIWYRRHLHCVARIF